MAIGFDTLAVAMKLYLCVKIRRVSPNQQGELNFEFIDQDFKRTNPFLEGENFI